MKKHILVPIVFGGLITFSLTTQAQDRPGQGGRGGEGGRGGADPREGIREAMIKKFDKNGDGKLDEKERPSREELQEFFRTQLGNGQGRRGEGGRDAAPRQNIREAMLKKFDKNGDGKLDEDERPSREEMQEFFRSQLGDGQGGRPGQNMEAKPQGFPPGQNPAPHVRTNLGGAARPPGAPKRLVA